jgi:hypothetical protein
METIGLDLHPYFPRNVRILKMDMRLHYCSYFGINLLEMYGLHFSQYSTSYSPLNTDGAQ